MYKRQTVISNGVEPEPEPVRDYSARAALGIGDDEFMISCFARCSPEKGVLFLIDAMARLRALTDRPFRCVICGDGELFDEAGAKIAELGLGERVLMAGYRTAVSYTHLDVYKRQPQSRSLAPSMTIIRSPAASGGSARRGMRSPFSPRLAHSTPSPRASKSTQRSSSPYLPPR